MKVSAEDWLAPTVVVDTRLCGNCGQRAIIRTDPNFPEIGAGSWVHPEVALSMGQALCAESRTNTDRL